MEIEDKYLSAKNCEDGDIIEFIDAGTRQEIKDNKDKVRKVINFVVSNGRYELIYTPGQTATDLFVNAWGRETNNWVGKKFQVKIVDSLSFGKPSKVILPEPLI